jgi:hypothetical protein
MKRALWKFAVVVVLVLVIAVAVVEIWIHSHDDELMFRGNFVTPVLVASVLSAGHHIISVGDRAIPLPSRVMAVNSESAIGVSGLITVEILDRWLSDMEEAGFAHLEDLGSIHLWSNKVDGVVWSLTIKTRGGLWYLRAVKVPKMNS